MESVQQWFMFVETTVFRQVVKSEISVAELFRSGNCTLQLGRLFHKCLRCVRAAGENSLVQCLAHFC